MIMFFFRLLEKIGGFLVPSAAAKSPVINKAMPISTVVVEDKINKNLSDSQVTKNLTESYKNKRYLSVKEIYYIAKKVGVYDPKIVATIAMIESSGDVRAYRYENHLKDASLGLMQTLFETALWLYREKGYKKFKLTRHDDLYNPEISIYFGSAYLDWLKKSYGQNLEWTVRAYNGGQGWKKNPKSVVLTADYWRKYQSMRQQITREIG